MAVPLAISYASSVSSQRRTGNKSVMMEFLSGGTARPRVTPIVGKSTLIVDGQALVMALGRLSDCDTFEDFGEKIVKAVLASEKDFDRIGWTFGRYKETSIKCATGKKAFSRPYAHSKNY